MNYQKTALALLACLALIAGTLNAFAQAPQPKGQARQAQHTIHDRNGDGICDDCGQTVGTGQTDARGQKAQKGKHFGPGNGTGNQGNGPKDGSGYGGRSGKRIGPQDGSGPKVGRPGNSQKNPAQPGGRGGRP